MPKFIKGATREGSSGIIELIHIRGWQSGDDCCFLVSAQEVPWLLRSTTCSKPRPAPPSPPSPGLRLKKKLKDTQAGARTLRLSPMASAILQKQVGQAGWPFQFWASDNPCLFSPSVFSDGFKARFSNETRSLCNAALGFCWRTSLQKDAWGWRSLGSGRVTFLSLGSSSAKWDACECCVDKH